MTLIFTQLINDYGLGVSDGVTAGTGGGSAAAAAAERPRLMLIDIEGFDCNITLGIDENSPHWPCFLIFEKHQCCPSKDLAFAYLSKIGYDIVYSTTSSQNAVAVLNVTKDLPMSYNMKFNGRRGALSNPGKDKPTGVSKTKAEDSTNSIPVLDDAIGPI